MDDIGMFAKGLCFDSTTVLFFSSFFAVVAKRMVLPISIEFNSI